MFNNSEVISYLQANKILAMKLDNAVDAVGKQVAEQVKSIGAGATRALFYTSCFTDEYNDVCLRQKMKISVFGMGFTDFSGMEILALRCLKYILKNC